MKLRSGKPITKYAVLLKDKNKIRYELEMLIIERRYIEVLMDLPDDGKEQKLTQKNLKVKPPKLKKK